MLVELSLHSSFFTHSSLATGHWTARCVGGKNGGKLSIPFAVQSLPIKWPSLQISALLRQAIVQRVPI